MSKWKDKLKGVRAVAEARAKLAKDEISAPGKGYNAAVRMNRDKSLMKWYDSHIAGHGISEAPGILAGGVALEEITQEQADIVQRVIDFAGEAAGKKP